MQETFDRELARLNGLIEEYGGVDSYTTQQAAVLFEQICILISIRGLDPGKRDEFLEGARHIFNLEFVNMGDYTEGKYVFVPNHVTEFDGFLFGTIVPNMLVVAKSDWISNPRLNSFIDKLFQLVALVRKDRASGMIVMRKCIEHLNGLKNSAVTIFVQQTIADIGITTPEDVAVGAYHIARKTSARLIPVFCEQMSTGHPTRIVFGDPLVCEDKNDFGKEWLRCEYALRDSISDPPARPPVLCEKHRKPISQRDF